MLQSGWNLDGCGRTMESACKTILYLLQQVNRTHLPPSTGIRISTDKSLKIDQQTAVSTDLFLCYRVNEKCFYHANQQTEQTKRFYNGPVLPLVDTTSYTEVFTPISEDIHRVLKSLDSLRALARGEYKCFSMR